MKMLFGLFLILAINVYVIAQNEQTARVQIIHNSADAAAAVVDVWLNDTKLIENFTFRTATPYIDAPAGVLINIGIASPNSTSWTQSFKIKQVVLTANQTYIAVAGGIVSTSGYTPAPTFDVKVYPVGREAASQPGNTDVLVVHGSTDAPTVDIYETGVGAGQIVNNLVYGNVAGYLELLTMNYVLEIRDETGTNTLAAYNAPLATLGLEGAALTVLASGFLNPANNSNGAPFGLYVALTSGGDLIPLPLYQPAQTARVQVIHNSADVLAGTVDVYINGNLAIDDFSFRTATPFIDLPAETLLNIGIAPGNSTSVSDTIKNFSAVLSAGEKYIIFANGLLTGGYSPNPNGRNTDFTLFIKQAAREEATDGGVDLFVFHGATDAPIVDVKAREADNLVLVDNAGYSDITPYFNVPAADYTLDLYLSSGLTLVGSFVAPLSGLNGGSAAVFASGFMVPSNNQDGEEFGLFAALPDGNVIQLSQGVVSVDNNASLIPTKFSLEQNFPNPFNPSTIISFNLAVQSDVSLRIFNILGQEIVMLANKTMSAGTNQINFDASNLNSGIYLYQLEANGIDGTNFKSTRKMMLTK